MSNELESGGANVMILESFGVDASGVGYDECSVRLQGPPAGRVRQPLSFRFAPWRALPAATPQLSRLAPRRRGPAGAAIMQCHSGHSGIVVAMQGTCY